MQGMESSDQLTSVGKKNVKQTNVNITIFDWFITLKAVARIENAA